jgi:hypothetical protein
MNTPLPLAFALSLLLAPASAQGVAYDWSLGFGAKSAAPAGDVDGDGTEDFAIAGAGAGSNFGRVELRSGQDGGLLWSVQGTNAGDGFGATLARLGDVDGDGVDDLAVAATTIPPFGFGPPTYVRVLSGIDGSSLWEVAAAATSESLGRSLARIADLDGDGNDDLIVGSAGAAGGKVQVRSGASGALVLDAAPPAGAHFEFGFHVAALGDVDGDGLEDFGVGDPGFNSGAGRISRHSGLDGSVLDLLVPPAQGPVPHASFGSTFDALGDVDGDGVGDLAVGAPLGGIASLPKGMAWVLSGASGAVLHAFAPEAGSFLSRFGERVAATEDVDGDGIADVRLCAGSYVFYAGGDLVKSFTAELRTYSGATGALVQSWTGLSSPDVAAVPDANGDGSSDVLVSMGTDVMLVLDGLASPVPLASCPGKLSSNSCLPVLTTSGTSSLTQFADLQLQVTKLPAGALGVCVYGSQSAQIPFGNGVLCVAPPFLRVPMQPSVPPPGTCGGQPTAAVACTFAKSDLGALGLAPGDVFYLQAWFRDAGAPPPTAFGLSGALAVQLWP